MKLTKKLSVAFISAFMALGVGVSIGNNTIKEARAASTIFELSPENLGYTSGTVTDKSMTVDDITVTVSKITALVNGKVQLPKTDGAITSSLVPGTISNVTINGYAHTGKSSDGSFTVQGSVDGSSYTTIGDYSNLANNAGTISTNFDPTNEYVYFKIVNGGARVLLLTDIEITYDAELKQVSTVEYSLNDGVGDFFVGETIETSDIKAVVTYDDTTQATSTDGSKLTILSGGTFAAAGDQAVNIKYEDKYGNATNDLVVSVRPAKVFQKYFIGGTMETNYVAGDNWDYDGLSLYALYKSGDDLLDPELVGAVGSLAGLTLTPSPATAIFGTKKLVLNGEYNSVAIETKNIAVTVTDAVRFERLTGDTLVEGDYVIYYDGRALKNTVSSDRIETIEVTANAGAITDPNESIIWHIAPSSTYWTIFNEAYNSGNGGYAGTAKDSGKAKILSSVGSKGEGLWSFEVGSTSNTYYFSNKYNVDNGYGSYLRMNTSLNKFGCYSFSATTNVGGAVQLYKKVMTQVSLSANNTELGLGDEATVTATRINGAEESTNPITFELASGDDAFVTLGTPVGDTVTVTVNDSIPSSGTVTVTATLNGTSDSILLNVYDVKVPNSIKITTEPKTSYDVGEAVDLTGMVVSAVYNDSEEVISPKTELQPDGYFTNVDLIDIDSKGSKTLTVYYTVEFASESITRSANVTLEYSYEKVNVAQGIAKIEALGEEAKQAGTATEIVELSGIVCLKNSDGVFIADKYNETDKTKMIMLYGISSADASKCKVNSDVKFDTVLKYYKSKNVYETYNPVTVYINETPDKVVSYITVDTNYMGEDTKTSYYMSEKDKPVDLKGVRVFINYNDKTDDFIAYDEEPILFLATFDVEGPDFSEEMIRKGNNKITITHKLTGFSTYYNVTTYNVYPSSITNVDASNGKTGYASGEVFDPTGYVLTLKYNDKSTEEIDIDDPNLTVSTGHEGNKLYDGDTHVTFTYSYTDDMGEKVINKDFYGITVAEKYVTSIDAGFSKKEGAKWAGWHKDVYDFGEDISHYFKGSLVITINFNDGTTYNVNDKKEEGIDDYSWADFNFTYPKSDSYGEKFVDISFKENTNITTSVPIVVKGAEKMELKAGTYVRPEYRTNDGDDLNKQIANYVFKITYNDGTSEDVKSSFSGFIVTGNDITVGNDGPEHKVTFSYKGAECSIVINVKLSNTFTDDDGVKHIGDFDRLVEAGLAELRKDYKEIDYSEEDWAKVQKIIDDTAARLVDEDDQEFDHRGDNFYSANVEAVFAEARAELNKIARKGVESISLSGTYKTQYEVGDELDLSGLVVTAYYDDNTSKVLSADQYSISGFNTSVASNKVTVTVSYGGKEAHFDITVKEKTTPVVVTLDHITVTTLPTKTVYDVGEHLNTDGMVVTAYYSDNSSKPVTGYAIESYSFEATGIKTITVTYEGKQAEFSVLVKEAGESQEVAEARIDAINDYTSFFDSIDLTGYSEAEIAAFNAAKTAALQALSEASTAEEIARALANARAILTRLVEQHNEGGGDNPQPVNGGLMVALAVGSPLVLAGLGIGIYFIVKKKKPV